MNEKIDFKKIKLVIWDLDDTFWKGTFSEEEVELIQENIELVKNLNYRGIVSSICSKNNSDDVIAFLKKKGIDDQFVFKSINWDAKAPRVQAIIKNMNLRDENVLFIDDNVRNLGEARYLCPNIMVSTPDILPELIQICPSLGKDDAKLDRLNQYKILETKYYEQLKFFSEEDFLLESNIEISFNRNIVGSLERICELNERAHQLNYTKQKLTNEALQSYLDKKNNIDCAIISCRDKYGDYGEIGFFALSKNDNKLIHFFFSCRTLGMHIEQFVYQFLGFPEVDVIQPVTIQLLEESNISYVTVVDYNEKMKCNSKKDRVLMIGPCDLETVDFFLPWNAETEFRYFDENKRLIGYGSHPLVLFNAMRKLSYSITPFFNPIVSNTKLFSGEYDLVIYSFITALLYGEYENKSTGERIVFGEWPFDATNIYDFKKGKNINFVVDENAFKDFSRDYKYIGRIDPEEQAIRIIRIVDKVISDGTKMCLILPSETPYLLNNMECFNEAEKYATALNTIVANYFKNNEYVYLLNPTKYIKTDDDYMDCIQHYSRSVYKKIADEISLNYPDVSRKKIKKKKPLLLSNKKKFSVFINKIKKILTHK